MAEATAGSGLAGQARGEGTAEGTVVAGVGVRAPDTDESVKRRAFMKYSAMMEVGLLATVELRQAEEVLLM